jgi:hypothetical protein
MEQNLDGLRAEIEQHLEASELAVFHSHARGLDTAPTIFWDTHEHPDFREFVQAAKTAGAKLMVFHQREFAGEQIEDALDELADSELAREHFRDFERRLKEARAYVGLVCEIELSFNMGGTIYVFDLRTDWFEAFNEVMQEIEVLTTVDEDEDNPIDPYFSKN